MVLLMQRDVYKSEDNEKNGSLDGLRVSIPLLFSLEANSKSDVRHRAVCLHSLVMISE